MLDIKHEVKLAFVNNKIAILSSIFILLASLILGFLFAPTLNEFFNPVVDELTRKVREGVIQLTFSDIFFNNIQIVFDMFVLGVFFCSSALILAFNGFFVGYYVGISDRLTETVLMIVPHGIFEFSSCILACASGFVLFNFVYRLVKSFISKKSGSFFEKISLSFDENFDKLKESFILLIISAILMIIAGIIEVYFTLPFAQFVLSI